MYPLASVRSFFFSFLFAGTLVGSATLSFGQVLLPMKPGMAVATCGAGGFGPVADPDFVVGIIDVRNPPAALIGKNWSAPMYHGPGDSWTAKNLGQIFGICIDVQGNIYVTATTSFGNRLANLTGPAGPGGVYKLDGQTGAISTFAQLPNSGPALGNICYDRDHDQFFVTNFEDGKIYRLAESGTVLSTFDPKNQDNGTPGFAPLGERPWGIGTYQGRVYYGIWGETDPSRTNSSEVRSVGLDANGEFLNDDRREFQAPILQRGGQDIVSPVSDIAFSQGGQMLIAERSMTQDATPGAHESRVLLYEGAPSAWKFLRELNIGNFSRVLQSNSAGGVDFAYGTYDAATNSSTDCDQAIWATGDALRYPGRNPDGIQDYVYGITRVLPTGNTANNVSSTSYYIDLNGNTSESDKTLLGDVEVFRLACQPLGPILSDSAFICGGDTVALSAPRGVSYHWTPTEGLNCANCRDVLASPRTPTLYRVEVADGAGTVTTHTHMILPTQHTYTLKIGSVDSTTENRVVVPVEISSAVIPDLSLIERFILTIQYPGQSLFLVTTTSSLLENYMIGTVTEGWETTILELRSGYMRVEFRSPTPTLRLRDSGTLVYLDFTTLLADNSQQSAISVMLDIPELDCISIVNALDTVTSQICGASTRLIEFLFPKYALTISPGTIAEKAQIDVSLPFDGTMRIEAFNALGIRVATLTDEVMSAGEHQVNWELGELPAGIYYVRASSGAWSELRQVVVR